MPRAGRGARRAGQPGRRVQQLRLVTGRQHPGSAAASPARSPSAHATSAPPFAAIAEPFDPGHPARTRTGPANCGSQPSTLAIVACFQVKAENTDVQIDTVQQGFYTSAPLASVKASIVAEDSAWLAARGPVRSSGVPHRRDDRPDRRRACLLARATPGWTRSRPSPRPRPRSSPLTALDLGELSWFTTPEGLRIAEIDTQGDQTGGVVIAWVIIGGADGFVVNPSQFVFQDGSFTDPGIIRGPNPADHKVADGVDVPVRHRLLPPVQGPGPGPGRRLRLRTGHPGRRLAVTPQEPLGVAEGQRDDRLHRVDPDRARKQAGVRDEQAGTPWNAPKLSVTPRRGSSFIRAVPIRWTE